MKTVLLSVVITLVISVFILTQVVPLITSVKAQIATHLAPAK